MVHIPGFDNGTGEHPTISFESACAPSHFVRQKNYKFVLGKKGDTKFGKCDLIYIRSRRFLFPFFFYKLMITFLVDFSLISIFKGKRGICSKPFSSSWEVYNMNSAEILRVTFLCVSSALRKEVIPLLHRQ